MKKTDTFSREEGLTIAKDIYKLMISHSINDDEMFSLRFINDMNYFLESGKGVIDLQDKINNDLYDSLLRLEEEYDLREIIACKKGHLTIRTTLLNLLYKRLFGKDNHFKNDDVEKIFSLKDFMVSIFGDNYNLMEDKLEQGKDKVLIMNRIMKYISKLGEDAALSIKNNTNGYEILSYLDKYIFLIEKLGEDLVRGLLDNENGGDILFRSDRLLGVYKVLDNEKIIKNIVNNKNGSHVLANLVNNSVYKDFENQFGIGIIETITKNEMGHLVLLRLKGVLLLKKAGIDSIMIESIVGHKNGYQLLDLIYNDQNYLSYLKGFSYGDIEKILDAGENNIKNAIVDIYAKYETENIKF